MEKPVLRLNEDNEKTDEKKAKIDDKTPNEYYTGNKKRILVVHICKLVNHQLVEIAKPIKTKIYEQSVTWNRKHWAIIESRFMWDYDGIAHQYVDVNDVAVISWQKDHADTCKKCGGKMTIDAREARTLGRRGIFQAIWGLDNTFTMLLIVLFIGAIAMAGAFMWAYNNDTKHVAELANANKEINRQVTVIETYQNITGLQLR